MKNSFLFILFLIFYASNVFSENLLIEAKNISLDKNTEKKILNTIHKFKGQITVIIISHDKSILEGSDHIYEIQNGKFKEN